MTKFTILILKNLNRYFVAFFLYVSFFLIINSVQLIFVLDTDNNIMKLGFAMHTFVFVYYLYKLISIALSKDNSSNETFKVEEVFIVKALYKHIFTTALFFLIVNEILLLFSLQFADLSVSLNLVMFCISLVIFGLTIYSFRDWY